MTLSPPHRSELAGFLRAMRARLAPEDVGLPRAGVRRTPGLRRQEVAQLAAVSIDWYIRLEQGRAGTPSAAVLDAIAEALRLSQTEREHLHVLARDEQPLPLHPAPEPPPDSLLRLLHGMPLIPAYLIDFRFDIHARNDAAAALFGDGYGTGAMKNTAAALFEHEHVRTMQLDWHRVARETVGNLRSTQARHRDDRELNALIERLCRDPEFALWWDDQTVEERSHGRKRLLHPEAGELTVDYDFLAAGATSELRFVILTPADPATEQRLRALIARHTRRRAGEGVRGIAA